MGLEEQIVKGAYLPKDPRGLVRQAQSELSRTLLGGMEKLAMQKREKKEEEKLEAELVEKEEKLQSKGYDNDWKKIQGEMDKNLGSLDIGYYNKANEHAKGLKEAYDACSAGKEGDDCRRGVKFQLNQFVGETADTKKTMGDLVDSQKKFDSGDLELSKSQTLEQKAILSQLDGSHASLGGSNDGKIAELTEQMKTVSGEEKTSLQNQIEALENNSKPEYGWDVSYKDKDGNTVETRVTKDMLGGLMPHVAKDITVGYKKGIDVNTEQIDLLKKGAKGGYDGFDKNKSTTLYEKEINEGNIASIYVDKVLGTDQPLKEHLKDHPVFTGMTYSELGIERVGEDDIIDADEREKISPEDKQSMINALSDPSYKGGEYYDFERSRTVAAEWMADNEEMEVNKSLYGKEYYPSPTGEEGYTIEDLTYDSGEGNVEYKSLAEYQNAVKEDKENPRNGEDGQMFRDRGGIVGAGTYKNVKWSKTLGTWISKSPTEGMTVKQKAEYYKNLNV